MFFFQIGGETVIKLKFEDLPSFEVMIGEGLDVRIEALEIGRASCRERV